MTRKNSEFTPNKKDEYRLYQIWKNLPPSIRQATTEQEIQKQQQTYNDPDIRKLIGIRTQTQFSQTFTVDEDTLTFWNQQPVPEEYKADKYSWVKERGRELWDAFIREAIKKGDPQSLAAYMKYAEGFEDTSKVKLDGTTELFDAVKVIAERNQNE